MIEPVANEVWVPANTAEAFRRFTAELDTWWPRSTHSISEARCAEVRIEPRVGGRLYEIDSDGGEHDWGRVLAWDEPERLEVTWHPGRTPDVAQRVEVRFTPAEGGTRVVLTHRGWEALGDDAEETRSGYARGWPGVLALYVGSLELVG